MTEGELAPDLPSGQTAPSAEYLLVQPRGAGSPGEYRSSDKATVNPTTRRLGHEDTAMTAA